MLLNLDKILDLAKNVVLLLLFSLLKTSLFTLLTALPNQFLDKNNKIFTFKVSDIVILLKF